MLTSGQAIGLKQLERIASVEKSLLRINYIRKPEKANNFLRVNISLDCKHHKHKKGGLKFHARESITLCVPPEFPWKVPTIKVSHTRFLGFPHVQWGHVLCLYRSVETQWQPSQGMLGLIAQLGDWFKKAALNELDAFEEPNHPPVTYLGSNVTFCMQADTPSSDQWTWFGAGILERRKDNLYNVVRWEKISDLKANDFFAPAILLNIELSFEYPNELFQLLHSMDSRGIDTSQVIDHLIIASKHIREEDPMYVIIGAPARGIVEDISQRRQHLEVWKIQYQDMVMLQKSTIIRNRQDQCRKVPPPEGIRSSVQDLMNWKLG